jgi:hypothetical protein
MNDDYTALYPRRLSSSYSSPLREPEISQIHLQSENYRFSGPYYNHRRRSCALYVCSADVLFYGAPCVSDGRRCGLGRVYSQKGAVWGQGRVGQFADSEAGSLSAFLLGDSNRHKGTVS